MKGTNTYAVANNVASPPPMLGETFIADNGGGLWVNFQGHNHLESWQKAPFAIKIEGAGAGLTALCVSFGLVQLCHVLRVRLVRLILLKHGNFDC